MHATIPNGNMGYDQYTLPDVCSCRTCFCCFSLALANICPWPLVLFFQISLKSSKIKTTHNTYRDCCVHFFRQPFMKWLYMVETHFPKGSLFWFLTKYKRINAHLICLPGSSKKEMCWYLALQRMRKDYRWRSMGCQV